MSTSAIADLLRQLETLEEQEAELSHPRIALHERMAIFPSDTQAQSERELSARRLELHEAIDTARIELATARLASRRDA